MIPDVVIDTNVLVHAGNPDQTYFEDAVNFLNKFMKKLTLICVDEGFDIDETKNKSLIGNEYLNHLRFGSFGYIVIFQLASRLRIKECSRNAVASKRKLINQMIRKPRDRTFLRVASNSDSEVLVSHDYEDFSVPKRRELRRKINVHILSAETAKSYL